MDYSYINNKITLSKYVTAYQILILLQSNCELMSLFFPNKKIKYIQECINLFFYLNKQFLDRFISIYNIDTKENIVLDELIVEYNNSLIAEPIYVNDVLNDCVYLIILFNEIFARIDDHLQMLSDSSLSPMVASIKFNLEVNFSQYDYDFKLLSTILFSSDELFYYLESFFLPHLPYKGNANFTIQIT